MSCPAPGSARTRLVLATSGDGVVFDQHYLPGDEPARLPRHPGHHRGGRYGYPACTILDGTGYAI